MTQVRFLHNPLWPVGLSVTGEFLTAMHAWVDAFAGSLRGRGIAIDGKTLRGSFDRAAGKSALHTITAFPCDTRLCLRRMSVDEKSNEIPAAPVLLKLMDLSGATVTLDAMHCQVANFGVPSLWLRFGGDRLEVGDANGGNRLRLTRITT